jgi:NADH-quinone oxidoreductase subunit N
MTIFLSLELFSLCLYVLASFNRVRQRSQEAGLKYFLLSSFASAFLLYGMALVYGATGSTLLSAIGVFLAKGALLDNPILLAGMGLMAVGLAFKMSAVPFHVWTPDVYEGSPGPVTAFMSVGTKLAAFAAFVRVFAIALPALHAHWQAGVWVLAVATMIVGNAAAVVQTNVKRMLAYSGVAHAGYILIAVVVAQQAVGIASILFYFLAYTFMNIGAFAVVIAVSRRNEEQGAQLSDFAGMGNRQPWLAATMAIFMFSLAGFPPTAGFLAKFYVFSAAVANGHAELAIIGVLCSLVSVYYYLRVVFVMYMRPQERPAVAVSLPVAMMVVLALSVAGSIALGVVPMAPLDWAQHSLLAALPAR